LFDLNLPSVPTPTTAKEVLYTNDGGGGGGENEEDHTVEEEKDDVNEDADQSLTLP